MIKCIATNCPSYFESDEYRICRLKPDMYVVDKCIGFPYIDPKIEMLSCTISKLTTELNTLEHLKDYIRDFQPQHIVVDT